MTQSNTMLTPQMIAQEALLLLSETMITSQLVYRDYAREWQDGVKKGDTVSIRRPATFEAKEFQSEIVVQGIQEGSVDLTLEKHFDVSFAVTSKEWTLELDEFSDRVLRPAVLSIAQGVNSYVLSKYVDIYNVYDGSFPDTLANLALATSILDENLVPMDGRWGVMSAAAKAKLLGIPEFTRADRRGDGGEALTRASMGEILNVNWYMDQMVPQHVAGTFADGSPATDGAVAAGATTMDIDGGSGGETVKKGDVFTVTDAPGYYVVTANGEADVNGDLEGMSFYPPAPAGGFGASKALSFVGDHRPNLIAHPNALALVLAPLAIPRGTQNAFYMSDRGIGIRFVASYDQYTKTDVISLDVLAGSRAIQPELAMRLPE